MGRLRLIVPDAVTALAVTGGGTSAAGTLANLVDEYRDVAWLGGLISQAPVVTFQHSGSVTDIALLATSLTTGDSVRIRAGSTTAVANFDQTITPESVDPESGRTSRNLYLPLAAAVSWQYWRLDFAGTAGRDIRIGGLVIGNAIETSHELGEEDAPEDDALTAITADGIELAGDTRLRKRLDLSALVWRDDRESRWPAFLARGKSKAVLAVQDSDAGSARARRMIWGRLTERPSVGRYRPDRYRARLSIRAFD